MSVEQKRHECKLYRCNCNTEFVCALPHSVKAEVCVGRQITGIAVQYEPSSSYEGVAPVKFWHWVEKRWSA
jgi:hypothetical protein